MTAVNTDKLGYDKDKDPDELIREAKAFYEEDLAAEEAIREKMKFNIRFSLGTNQWDKVDTSSRLTDKRPTLTIPRMNEFLNRVKNENRQNKPSIKVSPAGAKDEKIQKARIRAAKNRQGIIRHIQYGSQASEAYQTAFDFGVDIGRGWFRVGTEYVSPDSFDQKIVIQRIPNPFSVIPDRNRKEIDYRDMKRCFVMDRMSRERFKTEYPDASPDNWKGSPLKSDGWMNSDDLAVVEYYAIREKKRILLGNAEGETFYRDELNDLEESDRQAILNAVTRDRVVREPYVKWYKLTSMEILEEEDVLGKYIPVIPVIAVEVNADGEIIIKGMVEDLKDSQLLYNFWASTEAELLTLAPKAPYIAAAGQIEGYKKYWETLNMRNWGVLPYKPISTGGKLVPAPKREEFAGVPVGVVNAKLGNVEDMRAITGIHTADLGMSGQEKSGRAIIAQQRVGDTQTYHYLDNLAISISHTGRIINSWMPDIYDTERVEEILGEDDEPSTINLGGQDENGEDVELGSGEFDVVVSMGPNNLTKRQAAAESMMAFMKAVPNVVPLIYDLLVKNMDWPGAQDIAARLRKTIPPQILEQAGGEQQMAQMLQQLTQQVKQYEQILPALQEQLQTAMKELEDEGNEIAKDLKIQHLKSATDIKVAQIKAETEERKSFHDEMKDIRKTITAPVGAPGGQ